MSWSSHIDKNSQWLMINNKKLRWNQGFQLGIGKKFDLLLIRVASSTRYQTNRFLLSKRLIYDKVYILTFKPTMVVLCSLVQYL